jgi:predicted adenine nucleotide alpha hydrolase (AANH) superfamily ATPase
MKRLIHVCCANCLSDSVGQMNADGAEAVLLFANANIHPLIEFRRRRKSVRLLAERLGLSLVDAPYGLREFLAAIGGRTRTSEGRCAACYELRMDAAASTARGLGASRFTTTLLVSRAQDRDAVVSAAEEAAARHGVEFESPDIRALHGCDAARPRDLKLYKQSYCGCVFSEEERFRDTTRGE